SDKENAFFADGVQDEILTNLAMVAALKVISRTSVNGYRDTAGRNLRKIGQELGVAHLLEGSVQRAGNRVRINAQLIDARTDAHLWAQTYDRELADVFAIQSEIAKAIADQLQAKLSPGEKAAIEQQLTTDLVANALYVQAGQLQFPPERERLLEAVRLLDQAVARDPAFLLAYCQLARSHRLLFWFGHDPTPGRLELAHAAIQNAVRLDRDAGEVHLALAEYALQGRRDYDGARAELELAQRTLPNSADVYFWYGAIDRRQGRWSEAITDFAHAVLLDPRNVHTLVEAAGTYTALRRYPEAERLLERAVAVLPDSSRARISLAKQSVYGRADLGPLRSVLSSIASGDPNSAGSIAAALLNCAILARDAAAAQQAVTLLPASDKGIDQGNFRAPSEWLVGLAARAFHDTAAAQNSFLAARAIAEKLLRDQPDIAAAWSLLGQIDAALGRKEDAIREGRRACELMPLSKDAYSGPSMITDLAVIYAWVGEKDLALEQLALSAQLPAGVSFGELKLEPQWDSLRGDPRFEQIVASLAPK
ncbi:MAG: tetratricopeptide repeat protein, partial [Chthoniobacterales bacterium]